MTEVCILCSAFWLLGVCFVSNNTFNLADSYCQLSRPSISLGFHNPPAELFGECPWQAKETSGSKRCLANCLHVAFPTPHREPTKSQKSPLRADWQLNSKILEEVMQITKHMDQS